MAEFEDVIEELGAFGPYQIRVFILVSLFETPAAWIFLLPVWSQAKVEWICPESSSNETTFSILMNDTWNSTSQCQADGSICENAQYTSNYSSIRSEWDLVCDQQDISTIITTVQMVGCLLGAFVTGQLADTFGRRLIFYIVYSLMMLFSFVTAFANSWPLYMVLRFLVGGFFGGTMVINFVLPMEFIGPKWRAFCGCIGFWAVGLMTQAFLAYLLPNWRHLCMVSSLGGIFLLLTWWFVPESPRWLVQQGRLLEAEQILTKMALFNKRPVPDFSVLKLSSVRMKRTREASKKYTYIDLFRNLSMSKSTLILMFSWFVCGFTYYGTTFNVPHLSGNRYFNFFLSGLVEIPALIFVVLVQNRLGRKFTSSLLMIIGGASMFGILFIQVAGELEKMQWLFLTLALLGRSGIAGGWAAAQVFSAETFPTVVRNIGVGACSMSARIGIILSPLVVSISEYSPTVPYIIFGLFAFACGVLCCFLPETLDKPLEDSLPPRQCCKRHISREEDMEQSVTMESTANSTLQGVDVNLPDKLQDLEPLNNGSVEIPASNHPHASKGEACV